MRVLWICGLPEEVRKAHPVTDVVSPAWSWIVGHLPPPKAVELHILCSVFGMKSHESHFEHGGAKWHCFRLKRWEPLFLRFRFYWNIRAFVKGLKPDVVHGWGGESGCGLLATYCTPYAVVSAQGLIRMLCANARRWRIQVPELGSVSACFRKWMERMAYRRAHCLLVESEAARDGLRMLYGFDSEIVPHPLRKEFSLTQERKDAETRATKFLFVGQMTARKGAMDALRAFVAMDNHDARLTMVGTGDLDGEIDYYIKKHRLTKRVERSGCRCASELLKLMDVTNAILVPTYGDTGPTILKEALSQGVYPICYDNTGAAELVGRYSFGEVCATGDWMSLSKAMDRFYAEPKERNHKIAERVRRDLSRENAWESLQRVYARAHFDVPLQRGGAVGQRVGHFAKMLSGGASVAISFNTGIRQNLMAVWRAKRAGIKVVREINEWPLSVIWHGNLLKRWIEVHVLPKLFDGAICISDVLVEFWQMHGKRGAPILKLPMMVDVQAIDAVVGNGESSDASYVCYAGGMTEKKDGVETLKRAFDIVQKKRTDVELRLVHDVSHDEAIRIMKGAVCLVLARPDSLQASAGFPTKLGEYLATGRPVVVTRTGEIGRYLVDGKTAFLAEPGNVVDVARQIEKVISNPDAAAWIGKAGREIAVKCFDWHIHEEVLKKWLRQFI